MNLFAELRRRSVFRVAAAYLVAGWVVMQVVNVIAKASGLPDWADSLALMILVVGLPIAMIVAWAFELSPDGPKRTEIADAAAPVKPFRLADGILSGALVVVIAVVLWQQLAPSAAPTVVMQVAVEEDAGPEAASIAVLAFDDLSPGGDQEYFSDGISEELLNVLVGVEGLRVASRTSAFRFKGSNASIPEIAADLNVRHVVEGSVRRAGNTIRITAQLIDSATDEHLWSNTYDRDLSTASIFEIQDDIATAIVAALSEELGVALPNAHIEVEAATENLTAYELFLQARPLFQARRDIEEAEGFLSRAVELDPNYAEAWEMRAATQLLNSLNSFVGLDSELSTNPAESRDLAIEFADRALALDPNSSLAVTVNTFLQFPFISNAPEERTEAATLQNGIAGYGRALEINPHNATALNWRGITYQYIGYLENARADFTRCIELEPLYAPCNLNVIAVHAALGDDESAMDSATSAWNMGVAMDAEYGTLARLGHRDLFLLQAASYYGVDAPWGGHDVLYEMYRNPAGDFEHLIPAISAWAEAEGLRELPYVTPDVIIGNYDAMPRFAFLIWQPELAPFRASDEFQDFLSNTPLPEYWRTYGFPPNCRERDDGWIDCD